MQHLMPEEALRNELIEMYFELMHDKQHAIFHRPTFMEDLRLGRAPDYLTFGMMALVARFSSNRFFQNIKPWNRGRQWADESRQAFDSREDAISLSAVQGCMLLGNLAFVDGDAARESLYGAQAIRMVQYLHLPHKLSPSPVQRETEIRVWWTTWMMDTWTSISVSVPRQLDTDPTYPKPMEEISYNDLQPDTDGHQSWQEDCDAFDQRHCGLWAQMIPLTHVMGDIHVLNKQAVGNIGPRDHLLDQVRQLAFRLDFWLADLPDRLRNTPENLQWHTDHGLGRVFAALHFGYHHHAQLLFYQFLPQAMDHSSKKQQQLGLAEKYAARCKHHAAELSSLMWMTNTTSGLECLWPINGHLLVIASSVHLHTLLFNADQEKIEQAKRMLEQNFQMLLQMQKYWPCLHLSLSRLKAFQRACHESMHESFDMDQWMLRFLQEYASPVDDNRFGESGMTPAASTPEAWLQTQNSELHEELLGGRDALDVLGQFI